MKHLLLVGLILLPTIANADLVHKFRNPAFNGGGGYSAHVLALEQLQKQRNEEIEKEAERIADELEREADNTVLAKFTRNFVISTPTSFYTISECTLCHFVA